MPLEMSIDHSAHGFLGADAVVDARSGPFDRAVCKLTDGQVDVVLEFVANQQTLPSKYESEVRRTARLRRRHA